MHTERKLTNEEVHVARENLTNGLLDMIHEAAKLKQMFQGHPAGMFDVSRIDTSIQEAKTALNTENEAKMVLSYVHLRDLNRTFSIEALTTDNS